MSHIPNADKSIFVATADKIIANSATEQSALGEGIGSRMIPKDMIKVGRRLRIHGEGVYSAPLLLGSLVIKVKLGTQTIASVTTTSLGISGLLNAANKSFTFDCLVVFRAVGQNGKVVVGGTAEYTTAVGQKVFDDLDNAGSEVTVDTRDDLMVDVTLKWDSATASRSVKTTIANIMLV